MKNIIIFILCIFLFLPAFARFEEKIDAVYEKFTQKVSRVSKNIYEEQDIFSQLDILIQKKLETSRLEEKKYNILKYLQDINKKKIQEIEEMTYFSLYPYYQNVYLKNISENLKKKYFFKARISEKIVALTFDDGPVRNTQKLIKILETKNIPATFFVQCQSIHAENKKIFDNDLFQIGMHTYSHADYSKLSPPEIEQDIEKCVSKFDMLDIEKKYFRPAYGIITPTTTEVLEKNTIKSVLWNVDSQDWNGFSGKKLQSHVTKNTVPGSVILFHDGVSVIDLESIIDILTAEGYHFVPLDSLLEFDNILPQ